MAAPCTVFKFKALLCKAVPAITHRIAPVFGVLNTTGCRRRHVWGVTDLVMESWGTSAQKIKMLKPKGIQTGGPAICQSTGLDIDLKVSFVFLEQSKIVWFH